MANKETARIKERKAIIRAVKEELEDEMVVDANASALMVAPPEIDVELVGDRGQMQRGIGRATDRKIDHDGVFHGLATIFNFHQSHIQRPGKETILLSEIIDGLLPVVPSQQRL